MPDMVNRPEYLHQLVENRDRNLVKVITGIRSCGKSSLLYMFHNYLSEDGVPAANIIHMDLESSKYRSLTDQFAFYDYVSKQISPKEKTYLIFDELQLVSGWEKVIEFFWLDSDVDIYIASSNAYLLSEEFTTLLSGHYMEIRMLPLSFREFLIFHEFEASVTKDEKFQQYLQFGGMPVLREYHFDELKSSQTLKGIYSTIVLCDILQRNHQADQNMLHRIITFLCSNIGNTGSPNSIGNILSKEKKIDKKVGRNVSGKTIDRYITMSQKAFLFCPAGRYDVKNRQYLKTLGKNYMTDMGFRNMLLGYCDADREQVLENIVFLELIRRGYRVSIAKVGPVEVDFVAERANEKLYIQVTESMDSPEAMERELRPLQMIPDNYEKTVLSMDRNFIQSYEGIRIWNIIDWLLGETS